MLVGLVVHGECASPNNSDLCSWCTDDVAAAVNKTTLYTSCHYVFMKNVDIFPYMPLSKLFTKYNSTDRHPYGLGKGFK